MARRNQFSTIQKRGPREKYPWSTMEVGDSFFVPEEAVRPSSVRNMASLKGRDLGRRFSVTNGAGGMHVDRVE